ncbi:hypothetical protein [Gimesia algae]|uniref:Uncharacterized protein n=1 Tax=Gimesia algae TaxID=2527971 RepID=A0A517V7P9_9PLAN|nr:hypothetical protein [Gimesia algae]QDT89009.1 hypothetical protein Pan161_06340 [Gimesia algae]
MSKVAKQLESLRQRIFSCNEPEDPASHLQRLNVIQSEELFDLDFFGDSFGEGCLELMQALSQSGIAPYIRSLILRSPDEGANGTLSWDLEPMLEAEVSFSNLESVSIQQNKPGDHNCSIIGAEYEEDGVIAKLLEQAPRLAELTIPSAPSARFFEVGARPLQFLSVDAGFDTQDFILNLAKSTCFPQLSCFEWGEYHETDMEDYSERCTAIESFRELFASKSFSPVSRFVWRNPVCDDEQIEELKQLKPGLEVLVIRTAAYYV